VSAPTLVVLGASGSLGGAVCAAAERLLPGVRLRRASRRAVSGADVRDREALGPLLAGAQVAIDAVGPYEYAPEPLVRACREARCDLVDLADRAGYLAAAERAAEDPAGGSRVRVLSGCSAAPGLVEALSPPLLDAPGAVALRSWLSVGSRKRVSAALLYALLRPLGRRGPEGRRAPGPVTPHLVQGARFWFGRHPWPRGAEGARCGDRRVPVDYRIGMDHRAQALALRGLAPLLGLLPERALLRACRTVRPATRLVRSLGAERGVLAVEALAADGSALARVEILAPRGLDLAALPPVWAARALLALPSLPPGARSLADLASPGELAAWMRAEGWSVTGV
jgi:hypothetical protein